MGFYGFVKFGSRDNSRVTLQDFTFIPARDYIAVAMATHKVAKVSILSLFETFWTVFEVLLDNEQI